MKKIELKFCVFFLMALSASTVLAQTDSTEDYEDYSIYENMDFADEGTKRFASVKVSGKSPDKLISIGYDYQGAYNIDAAAFGQFAESSERVNSTQGFRFGANIPVISKNSIIVQAGFIYWNVNYDFENSGELTHPLHQTLNENGLNIMGLAATIYKPLNETTFLMSRIAGTMGGDYNMSDLQAMKYNRYAVAVLWGKRPTDYKQWALGISQTYRGGEFNFVPVILYNWTSTNRKWGAETLFPARGDVRYNFNPRSMLFFGFDLEGTSLRLGNEGELDEPFNDLELRRSELRFRFKYERQITGFLWVSAKAGYRYNWNFNVDRVPGGKDFFRGFFGDQEYVMENEIENPLFFNISINLVSP